MKITDIYEKDQFGVKTPSFEEVCKMHDCSEEDLKKELERGVEVEMEHTQDETLACEIALDHLAEDPKYYTKLKSIHKE